MYNVVYSDLKTFGLLSTVALASRPLIGARNVRKGIQLARIATGTLSSLPRAPLGMRIKGLGTWGKNLNLGKSWGSLPKRTKMGLKYGAVGAAGLGVGNYWGNRRGYSQETRQYGAQVVRKAQAWIKANPKTAAIGGAAAVGGGVGLAHAGIQIAGGRAGQKADLSKVRAWREGPKDSHPGKIHLDVSAISPMNTARRFLPGYKKAWEGGFWKSVGEGYAKGGRFRDLKTGERITPRDFWKP